MKTTKFDDLFDAVHYEEEFVLVIMADVSGEKPATFSRAGVEISRRDVRTSNPQLTVHSRRKQASVVHVNNLQK